MSKKRSIGCDPEHYLGNFIGEFGEYPHTAGGHIHIGHTGWRKLWAWFKGLFK
jgi:hypothetical protein